MSLIPTQPPRVLTTAEIGVAISVFGSSIDFTTVRVTNALGFGNAYWVSPPVPGFNFFGVHLGQNLFENPNPNSPLLIHELTHVWQGQRLIPFEYVLNSGAHQGLSLTTTGSTNQAYAYEGESNQLQWSQYNVEQQARIVQHWFSNGAGMGSRSPYDWRYRYIVSNIRAANPYATSVPVRPRLQRLTPGSTLAALQNLNLARR